jgi:small conductance mechanosensitive channel
MDEFWRQVEAAAVLLAGRLAGAGLALLVGWLVLRLLRAPLARLLERGRIDPSAASFAGGTLRLVVLLAVVLMVLQTLGIQTTSLVALLGAFGVAIALALQSMLGNFAAGLLLLTSRSVRVGDTVEVGGVTGKVAELRPFYAVLDTPDNKRVAVPNTLLTTTVVKNFSLLPTRQAEWELPLGPRADVAQARAALLGCLRADPRVLVEPAPAVTVRAWAADRRTLAITAWTATADQPRVQADMLEALGAALAAVPHAADFSAAPTT